MSEASPGSLLSRILTSSFRSQQNTPKSTPTSTPPRSQRHRHPLGELQSQTSEEREEILNHLSDVYFDPNGDPLAQELASLPVSFSTQDLEAAAETNTTALEAVSEKLSAHILRNYDAFAAGVDEVIGTEELLEAASLQAKVSREQLAVAGTEVQHAIGVWKNTQRKRTLTELMDVCMKMKRASEFISELSSAIAEGDFCTALLLCQHVAEATVALGGDVELRTAFNQRVGEGVSDCVAQIRGTVAALTTDFQLEAFHAVLRGYALLSIFYTSTTSSATTTTGIDAGRDVCTAFSAAPSSTTHKVLRGVLLARPGKEERAARAQSLEEVVALLPSDLFRTCLARVMMVLWDILVAHHHMHTALLTFQQDEELATASWHANSTDNGTDNGTDDNSTDTWMMLGLPSVIESIQNTGLEDSRRLVWDECSRAVGILLSSPAAVEGEHFMQVVKWTRAFAGAGEAFCGGGTEAIVLRQVLDTQASAFFSAYHEANVEALNSMVEKEVWKVLPSVRVPPVVVVAGGKIDNDVDVVELSRSNTSTTSFEQVVAQGNPWRRNSKYEASNGGGEGSGSEDTSVLSSSSVVRLGFGGPTVLEERDTVGGGLDVDEEGHALDARRGGGGQRDSTNHEEEEKGGGEDVLVEIAVTTNSSWRMAKWMRDYAHLMTVLPGAADRIFQGITELIDLYFLHIYLSFGDGALLLASGGAAAPPPTSSSSSVEEGLTPRLKTTLQHIALGSLAPYRSLLLGTSSSANLTSKLSKALAHTSGTAGGTGSTIPNTNSGTTTSTTSNGASASSSTAAAAAATNTANSISHSGNLFGLVERIAAGGSLVSITQYLAASRAPLAALLPPQEAPAVEVYSDRIVGAAKDLHNAILLRCCRLLLPLSWIAEAISGSGGDSAVGSGRYVAAEPPSHPAPWALQLTKQIELFGAQVRQAEGMVVVPGGVGVDALWQHAPGLIAAAVVDGFARVKKCTLEGRAAMSLDLQEISHALVKVVAGGGVNTNEAHHENRVRDKVERITTALRLVDDYVKAFYVPLPELGQWAEQHPGYTHGQVMALAHCIAERSGMKKRRDIQEAVAAVERSLDGALRRPIG